MAKQLAQEAVPSLKKEENKSKDKEDHPFPNAEFKEYVKER